MEKILTVSIAAYNVEKYLGECLDSFLQKVVLEKCEIIIVDDGSTDGTEKIAEEYVNKYPETFIYVKKENGGWGSTLNVAMKMATGKYFKQLDGDDSFEKTNLPEYIFQLEKYDADIVVTPYVEFSDETGENINEISISPQVTLNKIKEIDSLGEFNFQMHSSTFKTSLLKENSINITEKCFYTDVEFVLKALNFSDTIMFVDKSIYRYRIARAGQSVSLEGYRKHYQEHLKVVNTLLKYENEEVRNNRKDLFSYNMRDIVTAQYAIFLRLIPSKEHKKELKSFDKHIKEKYPQYYHLGYKTLEILRKTGFLGYRLVAGFSCKMFLNGKA